jgi:hypothetical protein
MIARHTIAYAAWHHQDNVPGEMTQGLGHTPQFTHQPLKLKEIFTDLDLPI